MCKCSRMATLIEHNAFEIQPSSCIISVVHSFLFLSGIPLYGMMLALFLVFGGKAATVINVQLFMRIYVSSRVNIQDRG